MIKTSQLLNDQNGQTMLKICNTSSKASVELTYSVKLCLPG